jgi:hypothetical protein
MWQCSSPPQLGGKVRNRGVCGNAGAHLSQEVRSGAIGHMAALEPISAGRRGPEPEGTWQHVDAHPSTCLDVKLVCRGTWSAGYRQRQRDNSIE